MYFGSHVSAQRLVVALAIKENNSLKDFFTVEEEEQGVIFQTWCFKKGLFAVIGQRL